jgi:formate hydrogenlyase subunit 6/NADH:ubiquinone oxidoreductase subunit I
MTASTIANPPRDLGAPVREYFARIGRAIVSTFEGLAVTASWLFRRPLTIQYPDRIDRPVQEMLPESYRGILEVDLDRCTGCLLCAKACPIDCITIKLEKNPSTGVREIQKFDIDIGRCMVCGLCTEQCKFDSISHTTDFEATADSPEHLLLHFAKRPQPVSKHKAGEGPARRPQGSILAEVVPACFGRVRWPGRLGGR